MFDFSLTHLLVTLYLVVTFWLAVLLVPLFFQRIRSTREVIEEAIARLEKDPPTEETQRLILELRHLAAEQLR